MSTTSERQAYLNLQRWPLLASAFWRWFVADVAEPIFGALVPQRTDEVASVEGSNSGSLPSRCARASGSGRSPGAGGLGWGCCTKTRVSVLARRTRADHLRAKCPRSIDLVTASLVFVIPLPSIPNPFPMARSSLTPP